MFDAEKEDKLIDERCDNCNSRYNLREQNGLKLCPSCLRKIWEAQDIIKNAERNRKIKNDRNK